MGTVYQFFDPFSACPPASGYATLDVIAGTNFPVPCLDYDASSIEAAFFVFRALNYGSGNITIDIDWYADTGSSGNITWGAQIACITPDTDTQDIETDSLATANTVSDTHLGTTNQRLHRATITLSNLDSIANGDWCILRIYRDTSGNTLAGDASLVGLTISYSDT